MNNLYGHAMSQCLPYAKFKWVKNVDEIVNKLIKIKVIVQLVIYLK